MPENDATNKTILHIPVSVSILVPIELDEDVASLEVVDELGGCNVLDITSNDAETDRLIEAAAEKMQDNDNVIQALSCLLQGVHLYKSEHPSVKAVYTPFMGVIKEMDV
jgi:hypothetical protein